MEIGNYIKKYKKKKIFDHESEGAIKTDYGLEDIYKMIPNRKPFVYLDKITGIDLLNQAITGERFIDPDDSVFTGHFPGNPVYPGVLQLEMISELFCCLYYFVSRNKTGVDDNGPVQLRATRMYDCLLQKGVFPGDRLHIATAVIENNGLTFTGVGQIIKDDEICVVVVGEFYII